MPHPQPILMHELGNDPPSFKKSPRKFSGEVTKGRSTSGGATGRRTKFQRGDTLRQQDENQLGRGTSKEPEGANAEEIKSLRFELQ